MADKDRPIIIKRKKVSGGDGHHGGAWKVAYADFVTAMMAFFMLMWLLNATTEKQRKGLADYFSPSIPVVRVSGGGDGMFQGDSMHAEGVMAHSAMGAAGSLERAMAREQEAFEELIKGLAGKGGDSLVAELALKHVQTRLTDEGLVIEAYDLPERMLFDAADQPTAILRQILQMIADLSGWVDNDVAVGTHMSARPLVSIGRDPWGITALRAQNTMVALVQAGLAPSRIARLTGHADRKPGWKNPLDVRNNRIEVVFLRRFPAPSSR